MSTRTRIAVAAVVVAALAALPGSAAYAGTVDRMSTVDTLTTGLRPCPEDPTADCGQVRVPVDWSHPSGPTVDIAVARRRATDPAARIGTLVVNPGGPGGSGVDFTVFGAGYFSDDLRRHFDLVGFDPRGVARSHPVVCSLDLVLNQPTAAPADPATYAALLDYNRRLAADCRRRTGPLFDHVDTRSVARDVDAIRAALGENRISFYGFSYGTLIGQQYAELFPRRVRAVALDSVMDHSLGTAGFLLTRAAAAQDSFDEFVRGCSADSRCSLYGRDIRTLWTQLLGRAARGELHSPFAPDVVLIPADLVSAAYGSSSGPDWFGLADYLRDLDAQAPPALAGRSADRFTGRSADEAETLEDPYPAVFCADWRLPVRDYAEFAALTRADAALAPDLSASPLWVSDLTGCLGWPGPVANPQHRLRVAGAPPLLVVNAVHDPVTPYAWAVGVADQLGTGGRLLTYEGWGHDAYGRSDCVTGAVDRYLVSGVLPEPGARCAGVLPSPPTAELARAGAPAAAGPRPAVPGWAPGVAGF